MNSYQLLSGTQQITFSLPDNSCCYLGTPNPVSLPTDPSASIADAISHPIGCPTLEDMLHPGQSVCIITDDNTRNTPVKEILPILLDHLFQAGIRKKDICLVMALGSHRHMTADEIIAKVGQSVYEEYPVYNSEFDDDSQLTKVGVTEYGTPIRVYKKAMNADIRIGIGSIVPHTCLGWSGGAKILYPGITSSDVVSEFHAMEGVLTEYLFGMDECPIRHSVEEWAKSIGLHFIINCILTSEKGLYRIVAGDYIKAHRVGCKYAREVYGIQVPFSPDLTIVASNPLTADFWQCTKALESAAIITKPKGSIYLLAPCVEGIGPHPSVVTDMTRKDGREYLMEELNKNHRGEKLLSLSVGVSIAKTLNQFHVSLFSNGLEKDKWDAYNLPLYKESALHNKVQEYLKTNPDAKILILPAGGETVPYL